MNPASRDRFRDKMAGAGALIDVVKDHPILYDQEHAEFRNFLKKEQLWNEIAMKLNANNVEVKKKWKNIRDTYHKYAKCKLRPSGSKKYARWQWGSKLEAFMRPATVKRKRSDANVPSGDHNAEFIDRSMLDHPPMEKQRFEMNHEMRYANSASDMSDAESEEAAPSVSMAMDESRRIADHNPNYLSHGNVKQEPPDNEPIPIIENNSMDAIDLLFMSYAKTVKTFSLKRQAIFKIRLAEMMLNEELLHLQESSKLLVKPRNQFM